MMLKVDGISYDNFIEASCEIRLDSLSNQFQFTAATPEGSGLPFKGGEDCEVLIDGETVLTGQIELIALDYDDNSHNIVISGRDKTAKLLDSTLGPIADIRGDGLTLKSLIEKIIEHLGLDIKVIDQANPDPFNAAEDIAAPEPGDNAFLFIEKYARKRNVLLTSDSFGNVVIATNSKVAGSGVLQHIIGAEDNNVISARFSYDTTARYRDYIVISSLNPIALSIAGDTDLASLVDQSGGVSDNDVPEGRQLVIVPEAAYSSKQCEDRAKWERNVRKARSLSYVAVVPGYRIAGNSGNLWTTNIVYQVVDDFVGKIEPMLANSVTYSLDEVQGSSTTIELVGQDAYSIFIEPNPLASVADNVI